MLSPFTPLCLCFLIYKKRISNSRSLIEANNGSGITVEKKEPLFAMPGSMPSILSLWAWGMPSTKQRPDYPQHCLSFPLWGAAVQHRTLLEVVSLDYTSRLMFCCLLPWDTTPPRCSCPACSPLPQHFRGQGTCFVWPMLGTIALPF